MNITNMNTGNSLILSVAETSLYVEDLQRSEKFYNDILGLRSIASDEGRAIAIRISQNQVLLLFKRGASLETDLPHDGSGQLHLAFLINNEDYDGWEKYLVLKGITIEKRKQEATGGKRLYFRDPDNHLVELITPGVWK